MLTADLLVDGDRIGEIRCDIDPRGADRVIPCRGQWILPGFINAHLHSHDIFLRAWHEGIPVEHLALFLNPSIHAPLGPRAIYVRTQLAAIEMLCAGFTSCLDTIALHPLTSENLVAALRAYQDAGMRAWVGPRLIDRPSLEPDLMAMLPGGARESLRDHNAVTAEAAVRLLSDALAFSDRHVQVAPMPSSPLRCTDELLLATADFSRRHDLPWQTHVLETRAQREAGQRFPEQSTVAHLRSLNLLSHRSGIVHAVWATRHELDQIADAGAVVLHNPICNLRFGSGVAPVWAMDDAHVTVAMGTDNASSGRIDPFETMRVAALLSQVTERRLAGPAHFAFTAMTAGGARACLRPSDLGVLRAGGVADLIVVDPHAAGPFAGGDPIQHIVYHLAPDAVRNVVVDGQMIVEDGRMTTVDEGALLAEAEELARQVAGDHRDVAGRGHEVIRLLATLEHPTDASPLHEGSGQ
jgi:cytosine/adenosine deaminase-related metal-dependent hydrolase